MTANIYQLNALQAFRERDKFCSQAWNERGLEPSAAELCLELSNLFDHCTAALIDQLNAQAPAKKLKTILQSALYSCNKSYYDTEEKEFICDLFHELAGIVGIDLTEDINRWMYGIVLTTMMKLNKMLRAERETDAVSQSCTHCGTPLKTYIHEKKKGLPALGWLIVKCLACKTLNLLALGAGVKEYRLGNYTYVETLSSEDYNEQEAHQRFEQIRHFRK